MPERSLRRSCRRSFGRSFRGRGFTLIELVVTVSIIILLVGITAMVGVAVMERAEIRRTEDTLTLLDNAVKEWETISERRLTYGDPATFPFGAAPIFDIDEGNTNTEDVIVELLGVIMRPRQVQQIIAQIDSDFIDRDANDDEIEDDLVIRDAWGERILAIHPGREHLGAGVEPTGVPDPDPDGSIRTPDENTYGVALNGRIFFVSAGPDGEFGDLSAADGSPARQQTQDNIYSEEPGKP